jgi:hypothetical protein
MGKILRDHIEEMKNDFIEAGVSYNPNSVYHGYITLSKERRLMAEIGRLTDFIEFLFEHSEHCDHISQSDAWSEFEQYEFKEYMKSNPNQAR